MTHGAEEGVPDWFWKALPAYVYVVVAVQLGLAAMAYEASTQSDAAQRVDMVLSVGVHVAVWSMLFMVGLVLTLVPNMRRRERNHASQKGEQVLENEGVVV